MRSTECVWQGTGKMESVDIDDWTPQTLPTWRHSNWVGVWDPWPVIFKFNPFVWYKVRLPSDHSMPQQNFLTFLWVYCTEKEAAGAERKLAVRAVPRGIL